MTQTAAKATCLGEFLDELDRSYLISKQCGKGFSLVCIRLGRMESVRKLFGLEAHEEVVLRAAGLIAPFMLAPRKLMRSRPDEYAIVEFAVAMPNESLTSALKTTREIIGHVAGAAAFQPLRTRLEHGDFDAWTSVHARQYLADGLTVTAGIAMAGEQEIWHAHQLYSLAEQRACACAFSKDTTVLHAVADEWDIATFDEALTCARGMHVKRSEFATCTLTPEALQSMALERIKYEIDWTFFRDDLNLTAALCQRPTFYPVPKWQRYWRSCEC